MVSQFSSLFFVYNNMYYCNGIIFVRVCNILETQTMVKKEVCIPFSSYVTYVITFKLLTLTGLALSTQQPPYLTNLLHLSNIRQLRSSISQLLIVLKTKLNFAKRVFSASEPKVWNEPPTTLKSSEAITTFRQKL